MRSQKLKERPFGQRAREVSGREALEDLVFNRCGVRCWVKRSPSGLLVQTRDYADYLLARAALSDSNPDLLIVRQEQ